MNGKKIIFKKSAVTVIGAGLVSSFANQVHGADSPSNRLNIGAIGLDFGMRNMHHMTRSNP